jgi:hypothetical protein
LTIIGLPPLQYISMHVHVQQSLLLSRQQSAKPPEK